MYYVSAQGIDECMINVNYYYYLVLSTESVMSSQQTHCLSTYIRVCVFVHMCCDKCFHVW